MRLFVAVEVPGTLHAAIRAAQDTLRRTGADASWTKPDQWHVTLKFLGDTEDARIMEVVGALRRASAGLAPAPLRLRGLGVFPDERRPRTVWAGIEDPSGSLRAAAQRTEDETAALGYPPERHAFRPHLTLGRVRSPRNREGLAAAVRAGAAFDGGCWEARELVLFSGDLKASGAEYAVVASARLGEAE
jgi:2'-5' RNA ligase